MIDNLFPNYESYLHYVGSPSKFKIITKRSKTLAFSKAHNVLASQLEPLNTFPRTKN